MRTARTNPKWIIFLVVGQASLAAGLVLIPPAHRTGVVPEAAAVPASERADRPTDVALRDAGREMSHDLGSDEQAHDRAPPPPAEDERHRELLAGSDLSALSRELDGAIERDDHGGRTETFWWLNARFELDPTGRRATRSTPTTSP